MLKRIPTSLFASSLIMMPVLAAMLFIGWADKVNATFARVTGPQSI